MKPKHILIPLWLIGGLLLAVFLGSCNLLTPKPAAVDPAISAAHADFTRKIMMTP